MNARSEMPSWLDPTPWLSLAREADDAAGERALDAEAAGPRDLAALLSPAAGRQLERLAQTAQALTRRHFGRTVSLYAPLYLSNYCPGGCVYCGFAADRRQPRRRLTRAMLDEELEALKGKGFEDVLLLTGERCGQAGFPYLLECVTAAAAMFHQVSVETFALTREEYRALADAGCTGMTLYQETYDPVRYRRLHRWGPKRDYAFRLDAPSRALEGGLRSVGLGALLGLADPAFDALCMFLHMLRLRREHWNAGFMVSFPRIRPQTGGYRPDFAVGDALLAQLIFAFRICLPEVPLVISTREAAAFRDGMAGVGICRMSAGSRTTVGGYAHGKAETTGQFSISDERNVRAVCRALAARGLEPVFKSGDAVFRDQAPASTSRVIREARSRAWRRRDRPE